jgi:hypothetical protein
MPKIPTFEAQGRPTAEVPSVRTSFQVPVTNDVFTKAQSLVANYYIKEREEEAKIKSLDYENKLLPKLYDAYDKHSKNPFPSEASSSFLKEGKETIQSIVDNELANENNFVKKRFLEKGNASLSSINLATLKQSRLLMEFEKNKVLNDAKSGIFTEMQIGAIDVDFAKQKGADLVNTQISDPDPTVSVNKKKFELDNIYKSIETLAMQKDSRTDDNFLNKLKENPSLYPLVDLEDRAKFISNAQLIQQTRQKEFAKANGKSIVAESSFERGADISSSLKSIIDTKFTDPKIRKEILDATKEELTYRSKVFKEKGAAEYYLNTFPNLTQEYSLALQDPRQMASYKQSMDKIYSEKNTPEQYRTYVPYDKVREINDLLQGTKNPNEKLKTIERLKATYGSEIMFSLSKQLQADGLPTNISAVISTNSEPLKKDILSAASTKDLEEQAKRTVSTAELNLMKKQIYNKTKEYQNVILAQNVGASNKTEFLLSLEKTFYDAALNRVVNNKISTSKAVEQVTDAFKADYDTTPGTYFIPKDVNGVAVNNADVKDFADTLLFSIEKSDYAERFHGKDGFAHYGTLSGFQKALPENIKLSTKETFDAYAKEKMINAMRKHSKWLLNKDSTGIVLHVELNNGTIPIVNADGKKIEFLFANMPVNERNERIEPGTGLPIRSFESELYKVAP